MMSNTQNYLEENLFKVNTRKGEEDATAQEKVLIY